MAVIGQHAGGNWVEPVRDIGSGSRATRPHYLVVWLLLNLLLWPLPSVAASCVQQMAAILAPVHIVDVEGGSVRRNRGLLMAEGRIVAEFRAGHVEQFARRYPAAVRFDGAGAYAMPGLFDMHVHALWDAQVAEPFLREFLRQGVTSVRDMGGVLEVASSTRAAIARCDYLAPNLWYAGTFLDGPEPVDPAMSIALANPAQARTAVRRLHLGGVDFIKVYSMLAPEILEVVVDEATTLGLPVAGHVPANAPISKPVFRLASVEHLAIEVGGYCPSSDHRTCRPILRRLVQHRVAQTPTLIAREVSTRIAKDGFVDPPAFAAYACRGSGVLGRRTQPFGRRVPPLNGWLIAPLQSHIRAGCCASSRGRARSCWLGRTPARPTCLRAAACMRNWH